ncbi:MAG: efflux RND transporter periplasmic adaptor subunit [Alphaproteobacteria bacterium]|nr:efflux RND transporter periplasmic adaptor subunit [Alphaproteobacteria bacterium]
MKIAHVKKRTIIYNTIFCILLIGLGWYLKGRLTIQIPHMGGGAAVPYVITTKVIDQDISPTMNYVGRVEAIESVDVKPRVTGRIEQVLFAEGGKVKKGETLFVIEQDQYIATFKLREAELSKAQAVLKQVTRDYERQKSLNKQKFASEAALDTALSNFLQAQASVKQAKANLDLAKIDLEYTEVKSPIDGTIGKVLVTQGNVVNATSQILARIVKLDPIRVTFSITDKDFLIYHRADLEKKLDSFQTDLILADGSSISPERLSSFINNEINLGTSTISFFTEYDNASGLLIPGGYIKVAIKQNMDRKSLLVPQMALSQDEVGSYAFVVNKDNIVEERRLVLGAIIGDNQVVKSGLKSGDSVIIQGIQKVANGAKVDANEVELNKGK